MLLVLKKFDFDNNFIYCIKILSNNQESCVITDGSTTSYFKWEKGPPQGDTISAYLFIIAWEIIFRTTKSNSNITSFNVFNHNYLHNAYADDKTFFLNDQKSIRELMKTFKLYSKFSSLKPNTLKVQSYKLCNNKYMIASMQKRNTETFVAIAVLAFKLLSYKVLLINRKDNRNC